MEKRRALRSDAGTSNAKRNKKPTTTPSVTDEKFAKEIAECLDLASAEQVKHLATHLVMQLHKTSGVAAAKKATASFRKTINDTTNNHKQKLSGDWKFSKGTMCISTNFKYVSSMVYDGNYLEVDLELTSSPGTTPLIYEGDIDGWDSSMRDFNAKLTIDYNPDSDTIDGELEVSPADESSNEVHWMNGADGGGGTFTAVRDKKP